MAFAADQPSGSVKLARPACFGRLDRLTIEDRGVGGFLSTLSPVAAPVEDAVGLLRGPVEAQSDEVSVGRETVRSKVPRQVSLLAPVSDT